MKIIQTSSRKVLFLTAAVMFSLGVRAEIFLGSRTNVNSLVVASNEVILISVAKSDYTFENGYASYIEGRIDINGTPQSLGIDNYCEKPLALAGPATLSFPIFPAGTNSHPVCICFQRVQGTTIQSLYVPPGGASTAIQVSAGKTCHLFRPICANDGYNLVNTYIFADVQTTSNIVNNIQILGGEEFSGPATLTFTNVHRFNTGAVVSFYLTDDSLNLPDGVLKGPTGSFVITVEKSTDLTNWFPAMIQSTGESQAAFYRLKFSH